MAGKNIGQNDIHPPHTNHTHQPHMTNLRAVTPSFLPSFPPSKFLPRRRRGEGTCRRAKFMKPLAAATAELLNVMSTKTNPGGGPLGERPAG